MKLPQIAIGTCLYGVGWVHMRMVHTVVSIVTISCMLCGVCAMYESHRDTYIGRNCFLSLNSDLESISDNVLLYLTMLCINPLHVQASLAVTAAHFSSVAD